MFEFGKKLSTPEELIEEIPFSKQLSAIKVARDEEIKKVFNGEDSRLLLIIGPCSADHPAPVLDYLSRLVKLQDEVKANILLIPRIYTDKPRTKGKGYKGMASHPNPQGDADLEEGLRMIRTLHINAFKETHMAAADEMLNPGNLPYLEDVLGYHAIGARTVESQVHRHVASGISVPVGMKNPTGGNIEVMLNAIEAAQAGHVFMYRGYQTKTGGNPLVHGVLRGAVDIHNNSIQNYHSDDLFDVINRYKKRENIGNPRIIIDVNHENSSKKYSRQPKIAKEVLWAMSQYKEIRKAVIGVMMESYIHDGAQTTDDKNQVMGKSYTDPCMGWEMTKRTVYQLADDIIKLPKP